MGRLYEIAPVPLPFDDRCPVVEADLMRGVVSLLELTVQLSPLLLRPAQLLHCGRQIEEMDGDDRCPGPQVGVADEGVQLPAGLNQAGVDLAKSERLLGRVVVSGCAQGALRGFADWRKQGT